jgi:outer membrane protein assembly factor BamB
LAPKLPPVYDEATLITVAPETHVLTALDLATGQRLWAQQVAIKCGADWLVTDDHIIFISPVTATVASAPAQSIVALDGATGEIAWRFDAMQVDDYLLLRGDCLFIFDTAGELLCLDVTSGQVMGAYPPAPAAELGEAGAQAVQTHITDDALYRLTPAGVLRVYDLPRPTLAYSVTLALDGVAVDLDIAADHALVTTFDKDQWSRTLHVFALPSGVLQWTAPETGSLSTVAAYASRHYALVARPDDDNAVPPGLLVFDLATGEQIYTVDAINHAYWISPTGRLITYGAVGQLTAYDLPTGKLVWRAASDTDGVVDLAGQGDAVYLVGSDTPFMSIGPAVDRFEVFDVASGARRWQMARGVEALPAPGTDDVLLGEAGVLERYPLARQAMP